MPAYIPCYCGAIRQATRAITNFYDSKLSSAGLYTTQFTILQVVKAASGEKTTGLAERLGMDQTTLARALKKMSEAGLLINKTGADRREKFWFLTQLGQEKLREAEPLWVDAQKDFKKHFGEEKARRLRELSADVTELFFLP